MGVTTISTTNTTTIIPEEPLPSLSVGMVESVIGGSTWRYNMPITDNGSELFKVSLSETSITDITPDDVTESGKKYRYFSGEKYNIFYMDCQSPITNNDYGTGVAIDLNNYFITPNTLVTILKIYAKHSIYNNDIQAFIIDPTSGGSSDMSVVKSVSFIDIKRNV